MRSAFANLSIKGIGILGGIALLLLQTPARAYIMGAESIEWVCQTSDRLVVGKVVAVDAVTGTDHKKYSAVTISISRVLKGPPAARETVVLHTELGKELAARWQKNGSMLFFMNKNDGKRIPVAAEKYPWALRDFPKPGWLADPGDWSIDYLPALTSDFQVLIGERKILQYVEHVVETTKTTSVPRSHVITLSWDSPVYRRVNCGSAVWFTVPVDDQLETLGRTWCKSDQPIQRVEGARILRYFKDRESIDILESLLRDTTNAESSSYLCGPGDKLQLIYRKKAYYVRQAAFSALGRMGIEVPRPILSVPLEGRDDDPHSDDDMDPDET